jgi:NAD(P)-dependent dehydrogenase (short-subunit alcohol dehydrogenase family)
LLVSLQASSLFSLEGRTALLTGATGFFGRTFARTLLSNGARLIALGRSERLEDLSAEWTRDFGADRVRSCRVDMYDLTALSAILDEIAAKEEVDVLVNNAYELGPNTGFNTSDGALEVATIEQWTRHFTSGIYWPALTVQKLGPGMKARGRGSIVNISTMYALVAPDPRLYEGTRFLNPPGYSAAKAGTLAFTRYVASFWGAHGVRANAILPGPFSNTEEVGANSVDASDPFLGRLASRTCLGRPGRSEELAGALLFLSSDASTYVTGHALTVDGGWTAI